MGVILAVMGLSYGLLAAAGVFTVFAAVGLIPRFAGATHTARRALVYEEAVVFGSISGCLWSVFDRYSQYGEKLRKIWPNGTFAIEFAGQLNQAIYGMFAGIFVGCLALSIAELLDSVPVFARRIALRKGIRAAIYAAAAGKVVGALFYFLSGMERTMR